MWLAICPKYLNLNTNFSNDTAANYTQYFDNPLDVPENSKVCLYNAELKKAPINIKNDLSFYDNIISCGLLDHGQTSVFDILGQEIRSLYKDDQYAGYYTLNWDAKDDKGQPVSAGVYIYSLHLNNYIVNKKMVLLK